MTKFFKAKVTAPYDSFIYHLLLRSYDYNMHVEGLLPQRLPAIYVSLFEIFRLQHIQMVNKTSRFKTQMFGNNASPAELAAICVTFPRSRQQTSHYKIIAWPIMDRGAGTLPLICKT